MIFDTLEDVHKLKNVYARFDQIHEYGELKDGILRYQGKEVAVVYFRHGYDSEQYTTKEHWQARETLEVSQAIKCPSANLQLLTFKKIQEVLGIESVWEEFNGKHLDDIKTFFKGMWGLEHQDEETKALIEDAKANPHKYVLKTQREGGGHNYFGDSIRIQLEKEDELWKYSLMERIFPVSFPSILLRNSEVWCGDAVSELGIFGKILVKFGPTNTILDNQELGCMMRTKPKTTDEGGVNAGYAYVD